MNSSETRRAAKFIACIGFMLFVLGVSNPSNAVADQGPFTWHTDSVTSSTYEAGASPDLTIALKANNDPSEQDLELMTLKWPDGLIPIADSSEYCNLAQTSEDVYYCSNPNAKKVGSQTTDMTVTVPEIGEIPLTVMSSTYPEQPQPGEAARLVSIPDEVIPGVTVEPSQSSVTLRNDGSGIDSSVADIPKEIVAFGLTLDIQIFRFETTINGSQVTPSGAPVLTIPAICDPVSFDASFTSYGDDGIKGTGDEQTATGTEPYPIANCQATPYSPSIGLSLTSSIAGSTSNLITSTASNATDAPTKEMHITLPAGFGLAPSGTTACGAAEIAAASCQSSSQLGTISVSSALSAAPIEGTVHMGDPQGEAISIAVFLDASFGSIQLSGTMRQTSEGGIEMAFDYFPPLPGSGNVNISLNSSSGGSLLNPYVCGAYNATSTYVSHNLKQVGGIHPLDIVGCQAQAIDTDLSVKLWKPRNNRYTDMRLNVSQSPRQVVDKATFYLPKSLKFKYKGHSRKKPLAYVEFWDDKKVKRARLFPYKTKRKTNKKKGSAKKRSAKKSSKSKRKPKKSTRSIKLKAKNKQLKDLIVTISNTKNYTKITLHNVPKDKELADFSIRLFGKRTRVVRTFKKCVKHRNLDFTVKLTGVEGDKREASYEKLVKCFRRESSKTRGGSRRKSSRK